MANGRLSIWLNVCIFANCELLQLFAREKNLKYCQKFLFGNVTMLLLSCEIIKLSYFELWLEDNTEGVG